jgi:hypothetical protein
VGAPGIEALAVAAAQDGSFVAFADGEIDGAGDAGYQGDNGGLVALAHDPPAIRSWSPSADDSSTASARGATTATPI